MTYTICFTCNDHGIATTATTRAPVLETSEDDGMIYATPETVPACDDCAEQANAYPMAPTADEAGR